MVSKNEIVCKIDSKDEKIMPDAAQKSKIDTELQIKIILYLVEKWEINKLLPNCTNISLEIRRKCGLKNLAKLYTIIMQVGSTRATRN